MGRSKRSSDSRALGIGFSSVCFLSVFQNVYFPWCGLLLFHTFYLFGALTVRSICRRRGAGVLRSSPTFGPGRTG